MICFYHCLVLKTATESFSLQKEVLKCASGALSHFSGSRAARFASFFALFAHFFARKARAVIPPPHSPAKNRTRRPSQKRAKPPRAQAPEKREKAIYTFLRIFDKNLVAFSEGALFPRSHKKQNFASKNTFFEKIIDIGHAKKVTAAHTKKSWTNRAKSQSAQSKTPLVSRPQSRLKKPSLYTQKAAAIRTQRPFPHT